MTGVEPLWDQVVGHFLEVTQHSLFYLFAGISWHYSGLYWCFNCILQLAEHSNQNLRNMALDALDQSICAVLGSEQFGEDPPRSRDATLDVRSLHCPCLHFESFPTHAKRTCFDCSSLSLFFSLGRIKVKWVEVCWVCCTIFSQGSLLFCSKGWCSSWVIKNSPSCAGGIYTDMNIQRSSYLYLQYLMFFSCIILFTSEMWGKVVL